MSRRPPDKTVLDEVRRLRSQLDSRRFQPLNSGLGLGRVRPAAPKKQPQSVPPPPPQAAPYAHTAEVPSSPSAAEHSVTRTVMPHGLPPVPPIPTTIPSSVPTIETPLVTRPKKSRGWFMIYACDAAIVSATLLTGALSVELLTGTEIFPLNWQSVQSSIPAVVLRELGYARSAIGFLILFIVYWLFFRIVAGSTLGEFFVKAGVRRREGKQAARS